METGPRPIDIHARYLHTAGDMHTMPAVSDPEVCVLGRSNVGKSSFINHVFNDGRLARVSKTPGKTRCAHFFRVTGNDVPRQMIWVDMPGYGHAVASKKEKNRWARLIADYCKGRDCVAGVLWLCDIRHPGTGTDTTAAAWIRELALPVLLVLTKADKVSRHEQNMHAARYRKIFGVEYPPVIYTTKTQQARQGFWQAYSEWVRRIGL
jgi:GTP-binding protein